VTNDEYLQSQIGPMLTPGEQVLQSAYMRRQPGLVMQMLFVGGLLLFLITKAYFVVITNRRMILIRTKMGFMLGGPKQMNLGVEEYDARALSGCTVSGLMNNRSMTFLFHQGPAMTLRISPWNKKVAGTPQFFEQVPQMISSGHLAQIAAGQPQQQLQQGQPQQQQGYPQQQQQQQPQQYQQQPPQQQQYQQQPQQPQQPPQQQQQYQQQPQGIPPGTRVLVVAQDGNRYPATVAQEAQGQYLCTMQDGQSYWFPMQNVAVG
jgi:hypothetical protein